LADSFNPNANGTVNVIVLQSDGKILVGGDFNGSGTTNTIGGHTRNNIARLDPASGLADSLTQTRLPAFSPWPFSLTVRF